MAIRTYRCIQSGGVGFPSLGPIGTVAATGVGTPPEGYERLNDGLDSTYWSLAGSAAAPSAVLVGIDAGSFGGPKNSVPGNTDVAGVSFLARAALGVCTTGGLVPYISNSAVGSPVAVSSSFTDIELPFNLISSSFPIDVTAFFNSVFGLLVDADCATGGGLTINVSEASMSVDYNIPTPIVTTLAVGDASPLGGTLRGTLIVNQQQIESGGDPGRFSYEFPVTVQFELGTAPDTMTPVGQVLGPYFGTIPGNQFADPYLASISVSQEVPLAPNTIYYFRVTAITEDGTTNGNTVTFTTPLTDRIKGVY